MSARLLALIVSGAYVLLIAAMVAVGYRHQTVRPNASHTPASPAKPEEGNHG